MPGRLVAAILDDQVLPIVCPQLLDELSGVLTRAKLRRYGSLAEAVAYVDAIADHGDRRVDPTDVVARSRDPEDDYLLALAVEAQSEKTVSGDDDLLSMTTWPPVVSPRVFLDSLDELS